MPHSCNPVIVADVDSLHQGNAVGGLSSIDDTGRSGVYAIYKEETRDEKDRAEWTLRLVAAVKSEVECLVAEETPLLSEHALVDSKAGCMHRQCELLFIDQFRHVDRGRCVCRSREKDWSWSVCRDSVKRRARLWI